MDDLLKATCKLLGIKLDEVNVDLHFVSADEIRKLNLLHRNKDMVTDVLSFPLLSLRAGQVPTAENFPHEVDPDTGKVQLGDIVICSEVAAEQAKKNQRTMDDEVAFLYVHALLHLLGYVHETEDELDYMHELTCKVLQNSAIII